MLFRLINIELVYW